MRQAKQALAILLTLALTLSITVFASAASYQDMPQGWSKTAMEAAVNNNLLQGNNGKLDPQGFVTRAQMAAIITRAFGATDMSDLSAFSDVDGEAWYFDSISKAVHMGILGGTSNGEMLPNRSITRQEVFVILARALKLEDGNTATLAAFADAPSIGSWAAGATAAMVEHGYVSGNNGYLLPTNSITREQFSKIMFNIFNIYITASGTYTENVDGSLMVNTPDVTIKDATISGDLIIGDGVGNGNVTLNNVKIAGRLLVRGGGVNSIKISGSTVGEVIVTKVEGSVRVVADTTSSIQMITIDDGKNDVIIQCDAAELMVNADAVPIVIKDANIGTVNVISHDANISLKGSSTVTSLKVAEHATGVTLNTEKGTTIKDLSSLSDMTVSGSGKITQINGTGKVTDTEGKPTTTQTPSDDSDDEHIHTWDAGVVTVPATCTTNGVKTYTCLGCHQTRTETIQATGHTWNEGEVTTPATENTTGVKTYTCTVCGATKTEAIPATSTPVAVAKGVSIEQQGMYLCLTISKPDDTTHISGYSLTLYDSSDPENKWINRVCENGKAYIKSTSFNSAYHYDKIKIESLTSEEGYRSATWLSDISITQSAETISYTAKKSTVTMNEVDTPCVEFTFQNALTGYFKTTVYNSDDTEIENEFGYNPITNRTVLRSPCNEAEASTISTGNASAQLFGWNVTTLSNNNEVWSIAFTMYTGEKVEVGIN